MTHIDLHHYLAVSGLLFCLGLLGVIMRRNLPVIYMCLELMLNAANLALVAMSHFNRNLDGQILGVLGSHGKTPGKLDFPHYLTVDSTGAIYVAEIKNWRVQKFVPNSR